jgi:hypothetical protein
MCDTEVYTVRVDSVNTTVSNVNFTSYINIPLRNVVKAELLMASLASNAASSNVFYIYVDELASKFNDRADLQYTIGAAGSISTQGAVTAAVSNISQLRGSIACIPAAESVNIRTVYTSSGVGFPTDVSFIEPIRQVKTLTVSILNEQGNLATDAAPTFLTLRFTCAKPNVCQYGGQIV